MAMCETYSFKCIADEERQGDFKKDQRIHEVLEKLVK